MLAQHRMRMQTRHANGRQLPIFQHRNPSSLVMDLLFARSPWLLGVGVISGWAALSGIACVVGSGLYDRDPLAPVSLYIWTMHFALPMTTLPHVLRAFRLR